MSVADIQAFLETLGGPLKSLVTTDYVNPGGTGGKGTPWVKGQPKKSAAQIIYEAAKYWNLNPKVILATLQKEQSLLTVSSSTKSANAARLIKAMGCGVYGIDPKTGHTINRLPGFGNQVFNGARVLSTYEVTYGWYAGKPKAVTGHKTIDATQTINGVPTPYHKTVHTTIYIIPKNACTFALYTYTPYYPQKLFWDIYTRYFGDTHASPRLRPVYRFRSHTNGTYYYTASEAKRYTLIRTAAKTWVYEGVSFSVDTSAAANTVPLYQLHNSRTHKYLYTTYTATRDRLLKVKPKQWRVGGIVCYVSRETFGTSPVYALEKKTTHGIVLTSSGYKKTSLTTGRAAPFVYRGVAFRLDAFKPVTLSIGPS
jgi:hypothetical protein